MEVMTRKVEARSRLRRALRVSVVVLGVAACGPSLTTVHEGTIRFEHCYRLDLEPGEAKPQREGCWKLWLASYTYGQPRDRIDHARRRLRSLANGDKSRPVLRVAGEHRPEERQFYLVMPGPTSLHHPPPPIATVQQPAPNAKPAPRGDGAVRPPSDGCAESCRKDWEACCEVDAGAACDPCQRKYTSCMRACFQ
jgi:hypothetical protein